MGELVSLIAKFGIPVVLVAALVFVIIRGRINFQYPRDPDQPIPPPPTPPAPQKKELSSGD
jgi:hypothetical protein